MATSEKIQKCTLYVDGMHCAACEILIEDKVFKLNGVSKVNADLAKGSVEIETSSNLNINEVNSLIAEHGYTATLRKSDSVFRVEELFKPALLSLVIFAFFMLIQQIDFSGLIGESELNLPFYFLIGVIASLSTCMAVVGGIVLSISSNYSRHSKYLPMLSFHISRLLSFFFLGGLLGTLGGIFFLDSNPLFRTVINITLFIVMILLGLNLLDVFNFTKKFQLKLPKFFAKRITNSDYSQRTDLFASISLGILTFILPCGFTQSVQLQALSTGDFFAAGTILLAFALGTLPVLGGISFLSYKISKTFQSSLFYKTSGFIIILFASYTFLAFLRTL